MIQSIVKFSFLAAGAGPAIRKDRPTNKPTAFNRNLIFSSFGITSEGRPEQAARPPLQSSPGIRRSQLRAYAERMHMPGLRPLRLSTFDANHLLFYQSPQLIPTRFWGIPPFPNVCPDRPDNPL